MLRLAVVGSGALARATCLALPSRLALSTVDGAPRRLHVTVLGRSRDPLVDLCTVAGLRAADTRSRYTPVVVPTTDEAALTAALATARPAAVLVCASTQSPWERLDAPSRWTALLERAGFGLSLPFQAQIALTVSRAARTVDPDLPVVNACFPDAVNPLLAAIGAGVLTGVGNVGLLAAAAQAALGLPDQRRLRLLAHHLHLHAPADPRGEAVAFLDDRPRDDVGALLSGVRAARRRGLNDVTGALAAQLLVDLATGATRDTHLPGVLGLAGGYPVRVHDGRVELRLPEGYPLAHALAVQREWSLADGVLVGPGRVDFGPAARAALAPLLPRFAAGFDVSELPVATAALADLRDRLRPEKVGDDHVGA